MTRRDSTLGRRHRAAVARNHPPCHVCGGEIDYRADWLNPFSFSVDHIVPLAKGGMDTLDNCAPSHRACNRAKSDVMPGVTFITSRNWV